MATKTIRIAITAALAVAAVAASCAVAGEAAILNYATGRKDVPVAGVRVGFALTMAKRTIPRRWQDGFGNARRKGVATRRGCSIPCAMIIVK